MTKGGLHGSGNENPWPDDGRLRLVEPLPYVAFLSLVSTAAGVLTDSGGIQEETTFLGVPCFTLRDSTERPVTVELGTNVLLGLEVRVQKIVVNDLKDDTFYALIWVERDGQMMTIDSRPSDALALALRMDCPIYVDELVLKNSKVSSAFSERNTNEQLRNWLEGLSDEDLGRYKM